MWDLSCTCEYIWLHHSSQQLREWLHHCHTLLLCLFEQVRDIFSNLQKYSWASSSSSAKYFWLLWGYRKLPSDSCILFLPSGLSCRCRWMWFLFDLNSQRHKHFRGTYPHTYATHGKIFFCASAPAIAMAGDIMYSGCPSVQKCVCPSQSCDYNISGTPSGPLGNLDSRIRTD